VTVPDAGTQLISDPGYKHLRDAQTAGVTVTTIPGPSATVAALTLAGLPTDRFAFFGFLPVKPGARAAAIAQAAPFPGTLLFYESGPRLAATLAALAEALGDREAAVAREISKAYEETVTGTLPDLAARYAAAAPPKGEIVIVVGPPGEAPPAAAEQVEAALAEAITRLPAAKAAGEVAKRFGADRKALYARALEMKGQ